MSNPLKRRMAQAAILLAAGTAPVVGAAGSASAVELNNTGLGGLTELESNGLGETVDGAAKSSTEFAGQAGGELVSSGVPAVGKAVGEAGRETLPASETRVGETVAGLGTVVGDSARSVGNTVRSLDANGLTNGDGVPDTLSLF